MGRYAHAHILIIKSANIRKNREGLVQKYHNYLASHLRTIFLGLVKHEKPEALPSIRPEALPFTPGENASFFIVRLAKENVYWISETPEDKHLKAFFGVVVAETISDQVTRFHVFTSVKYIHWTGPIYFNIIRPFHHLVVSSMMRYGVKNA